MRHADRNCAEATMMTSPLKKFDLTGRAALITGGAGLLGVEHAAALAAAGATVVIADIREDSGQKALIELRTRYPGQRFLYVHMDVTSPESIRAAHADLLRQDVAVRV